MSLTEKFLEDIYDNFPNTQIYKLNEIKWWGAYPIKHKQINDANSINKKSGIYFTPNWDFWLSEGKRTKDRAKNIYCLFVDRDDNVKFWENFIHEPSIVVATKKGYHAYWLFKTHYPIKEYESKRSNIMESLIQELWWDQQAKDIPRIMRLPWTKYWKDNEWDFIIDVIKYNPEIKYGIEDFDILYNKPKKLEQNKKRNKNNMQRDTAKLVDDIDEMADVWEVLERLWWWTREIKWNDIYEWGKITRWYKKHPTNNYIINWSASNIWKERPEWQPFAVAKQLLWNAKEAFKFFKEEYDIWVDDEEVTSTEVKKDEEEQKITLETPIWEIEINYSNYNIIQHTQDWNSREIMDGVLERIWFFYDQLWIKNYIIKYHKSENDSWMLVAKELGRPSEFDRWLSSVGITFFGSKSSKLQIISFLQSVSEEYIYIDSLWIYWKELIVKHTWQYIMEAKDKKYFIDIKDNNKGIWVWQQVINVWESTDVRQTIDKLSESYEDHIILTLFTSFAVSMFSYYLRENFRFAPIVWLVWLTNWWKTTNRRLMNKLFWIETNVAEIQSSSTEFPVMSLVKHYIPLWIAEYQNDKLKFDWDTFLKNNYDNTQNVRWTPSQTTRQYANNAMLFIDWETRSLNNAVYTRSIMLHFNPRYIKKPLDWKFENILKYFIDNHDNIFKLDSIFLRTRDWLLYKYKNVDRYEKARIIDNYSLLIAFSECFGFKDKVEDALLKQLEEQFKMMWVDNIDKTIKIVMRLANLSEMPVSYLFYNNKYLLKIEFQVDVLRINTEKLADIQSMILLINNHFFPEADAPDDILYIPIDYIIKNKALHIYFNNIMKLLLKNSSNDIPKNMANIIKDYASEHWYTKSSFYYYLSDDFNLKSERDGHEEKF